MLSSDTKNYVWHRVGHGCTGDSPTHCVYAWPCRHRFHDDPFTRIGLQDIGAWVDFSAAADAAQAVGLTVAGFTTQAHFLIGCGIGAYMSEVSNLDLVQRLNLSRQAMLLTLPGEMGERFKALGLARGYDAPLSGFSVRDLRRLL